MSDTDQPKKTRWVRTQKEADARDAKAAKVAALLARRRAADPAFQAQVEACAEEERFMLELYNRK
jgi:hypothetical protein